MSINILDHEKSKRVKIVNLKEQDLDKLIFPFKKHSITSLEYKPFSRFTIAKTLDDCFKGELSKKLNEILKDRNSGTVIVQPSGIRNLTRIFGKTFYLFSLLSRTAKFDSMTGKYYARFEVKHTDSSDSYLRKAYSNLDLHTDGTYVKEKTDWLIMTKMEETNVSGGESVILHLDDWEYLDELSKDPVGRENFVWSSPKSKNVEYKVEHPVFKDDDKGKPIIS